jgi:hypothetical protein
MLAATVSLPPDRQIWPQVSGNRLWPQSRLTYALRRTIVAAVPFIRSNREPRFPREAHAGNLRVRSSGSQERPDTMNVSANQRRSDLGLPARIFRFTRDHWLGALLSTLVSGLVVNALSDYFRLWSAQRDERTVPTTMVRPQVAQPQAPAVDTAPVSSSPLVHQSAAVLHGSNYVNAAAVGKAQTLVHIADARDRLDVLASAEVANALDATGGGFTDAFGAKGAFRRSFGGDDTDLRAIEGIDRVPLILLGRLRIDSSSNDTVAQGLRKADATLDYRTYRPSRGFLTQVAQLRATGAGFSDADATAVAVRNLVDQLKVIAVR